ncbi:DegV family protein [Corynebacterium sp. L4756]|uniref:DegV family protein n=1 Tax=unclassified Corynebacterium TaxID=2624378 RepID=UPI00374CE16D
MPVRIVTDSSAGLPEEIINELDITVCQLHIMENEDETSTSALSALEIAAEYGRQMERGGDEGLLGLHLAKELSSTWSAAATASGVFPDDKVRVIDSGTAGMVLGAAAMAAAKLAADGADIDECYEAAEDTLSRGRTWVYLSSTDELRRSGRMSATTAMISTALLATKPIMALNDGKLELVGRTRTQTKGFIKLVDLVASEAGGKPVFMALQHYDAEEQAEILQDLLEQALPDGSSFILTELTEVVAVHVGPGAIGVSAVYSV